MLNKKDLVEPALYPKIVNKVKNQSEFIIENVFLTNCKAQNCKGMKLIIPTAIELIKNSNRFNRADEKEHQIMIIGVPNVGKSSFVNALRNRHLNKKGTNQVGGVAGVTRSVQTRVKISEDPLIYLLDTPGVLEPKVRDDEMGMKLALCACFQDHLVGEDVIADFLLYWLNKNSNFLYVDKMGLDEPSDDILHVLLAGANKIGKFSKLKNLSNGEHEWKPDLLSTARYFIASFRRGEFGPVCLDDVAMRDEDNERLQ